MDGFKVLALDPVLMRALLEESKKQGLGVAAHLSQLMVARFNAIQAAEAGLTTLEHWYGLPESLFDDRSIQNYPADYNYQDESHRFGQAGRLWKQAAEPGSTKWNDVMERFLKQDFVFSPTLTIYEASRDAMRKGRRAKNAAPTATARQPPAAEGAAIKPNASGSSASDQLPCSFGRTSSRHWESDGSRIQGSALSMPGQ